MDLRNKNTHILSSECNEHIEGWFDTMPSASLTMSRPKKGFTLIEVLLALAIIGMVLTPILMIQSMIVRNTSKYSRLITRILQGKKFLIDSEIALTADLDQSTAEKKVFNPETSMKYEMNKIPDGSALKKFKRIYKEAVTLQWRDQQGRHQEQIVTFIFRPESKKT
jgi:prepilin-type N-terminal cleavage/methylation domain-containing protein